MEGTWKRMGQGEDEGTRVLAIWTIQLDKGCRSFRKPLKVVTGGQGAHERWKSMNLHLWRVCGRLK